MNQPRIMIAGCSFSDPLWQQPVPWSVQYGKVEPCYVVAKAGMGIRGICTESLYFLHDLENIKKLIILLPTLWRMDIEVDRETYLCNAMVDLLLAGTGNVAINCPADRKWIISGGLHYDRTTEQGKIFESLYKHQGFLVLLKEHVQAFKNLIDHAKNKRIAVYISAIQDPLDQLTGLDYIQSEIYKLLEICNYQNWFRFDGLFVDKFLGHDRHPTEQEHKVLLSKILEITGG